MLLRKHDGYHEAIGRFYVLGIVLAEDLAKIRKGDFVTIILEASDSVHHVRGI